MATNPDGVDTPSAPIDWGVIKLDNGPESHGRRAQFLSRLVAFADAIGKPIQLLYYPPYHSKYDPIERCWGILEQHWNGTNWSMSRPCWNGPRP